MLSTLPFEALLALGRQRWLVAVLAQFHARRGQRFAELLHALGLPRDSLVRTLEAAQELGWVVRNSGHGHPLRPEYLLTPSGEAVAAAAMELAKAMAGLGVAPGDITRWGLPVLRALAGGQERFNQLARSLAPASPRALSQCLRALVANDLVDREVEGTFPPGSRYRLTSRGALLAG
jgi:DNA-binding HxlR family transcriptional regulator